MTEPRLRRVATVSELDAAVEDYLARGYAVVKRGETRVLLQRHDPAYWWTHFFLAVTTAWWCLGLGNALYEHWYRTHPDRVLVRLTSRTETAS